MKPLSKPIRNPSDAEKQEAKQILLALMRTPKTRPGLVAAVANKVGRRHVYGWLGDWLRTDVIVQQKGSNCLYYMLPSAVPQIFVKPSIYPTWLDPRFLYQAVERRVYIAGRLLGEKESQNNSEEDEEDGLEQEEAQGQLSDEPLSESKKAVFHIRLNV